MEMVKKISPTEGAHTKVSSWEGAGSTREWLAVWSHHAVTVIEVRDQVGWWV